MKEHPLLEQYQLVEEHHFIFENIPPRIIGRIFKIVKGVNAEFTWELNYYCRKENEFDAYHPSAPFGQTLEETRRKLMKYVERFEDASDWHES